MALGSTQPLTEMSTRILPGERGGGRRVRLTSPPSECRLAKKCGNLDLSHPYGSSRPVTTAMIVVSSFCRVSPTPQLRMETEPFSEMLCSFVCFRIKEDWQKSKNAVIQKEKHRLEKILIYIFLFYSILKYILTSKVSKVKLSLCLSN
jgi:hypothetical protein